MIQALVDLERIEFLVTAWHGDHAGNQQSEGVPLPFSESVMAFLGQLSGRLMKPQDNATNSELVSLGYWIRPSNLNKLQQRLVPQTEKKEKLLFKPLGTVLHIAPSNVDIQFFYSWVISLLMGNANIVRMSQVESDSKSRLIAILQEILSQSEHQGIACSNAFVTWPHNDQVTTNVSLLSDARMLWGSDESIQHIRGLPAKLSCRDIVFSDKYSVALVDTDEIDQTQEGHVASFAEALSRDISAFSQRACSSPLVVFDCSGSTNIPEVLLRHLNKLGEKNDFTQARGVNHLVSEQMLTVKGYLKGKISQPNIQILQLREFSPNLLEWHSGESQLFWVKLASPEQLIEFIDEKCQTISYFGIKKHRLLRILEQKSIYSIDRVVPLGRALEFNVIWDGYDLFSQLTRQVSII